MRKHVAGICVGVRESMGSGRRSRGWCRRFDVEDTVIIRRSVLLNKLNLAQKWYSLRPARQPISGNSSPTLPSMTLNSLQSLPFLRLIRQQPCPPFSSAHASHPSNGNSSPSSFSRQSSSASLSSCYHHSSPTRTPWHILSS
ncbi:hypothetical protein EX30DRAFT_127120 [Ascodesmis nigricans]|uniref:Uncharacterized protein n=1 Tax=Ascodesmis nigricans TaxID=341454 RepID=A0A4S2MSH7_9PEZI|nr:hypothetical protein EX30DRAFT_127120 [Ascodesmis nigricans]